MTKCSKCTQQGKSQPWKHFLLSLAHKTRRASAIARQSNPSTDLTLTPPRTHPSCESIRARKNTPRRAIWRRTRTPAPRATHALVIDSFDGAGASPPEVQRQWPRPGRLPGRTPQRE